MALIPSIHLLTLLRAHVCVFGVDVLALSTLVCMLPVDPVVVFFPV